MDRPYLRSGAGQCDGSGSAPQPAERGATLPGFGYHLVQGVGWGLGFALAGGIVTLIFYGLIAVALATHATW